MTDNTQKKKQDAKTKAIAAPCRTVSFDAPFRRLKKGYCDFKKVPSLSLTYGIVMMLISIIITYVAYSAHSIVLAIALIAGFFFMGPAIAIGLYYISRQIHRGLPVDFRKGLKESKKNIGEELILAFVFLIVFLIWVRSASMVHIFFPSVSSMEVMDWIKFLSIGSAIGAIFAVIIFCMGAFSIQMIMDRDTDAITAILTSINAVLKNKRVMMIWGLTIVSLVLIGILTLFIGFAVFLPILGHASWHAYREVIDIEKWDMGIILDK